MRHWSQLATRNWRVKRVRTAGTVLAIALGTGAIVWVTCCYESVRRTMLDWAAGYIGDSHISIQSPMGKYDTLPERLVGKIEQVKGVAHVAPMLVQRLPSDTERQDEPMPDALRWPTMPDVDFHGIDLEREAAVRDWGANLVAGRMLAPDDRDACVLELSIAEEQGVGVGDRLLVWGGQNLEEPPAELEIVGLIHRERIARFQKGVALLRLDVLQDITRRQALVNSIDVVVDEVSVGRLRQVAHAIYARIRGDVPSVHVRSAEARMQRIEMAQEQQQVVLILLSCMALLTALFIILSTLSMGMIERISQLGLLRCVGMTGTQLAGLVVAEVLPLGIVGSALGVPTGLALTQVTVEMVPEYVGKFVISWSGIALACGAGLATTLLAASLPALAALTVTPLEATRPRARRAGVITLFVTFAVAVLLMGLQHLILKYRVQRDLDFVHWSAAAIVLLYLIYACAAPLCVWLVSWLAVPVTSLFVQVRSRLLQDQVGHAVWRSAGICCGLMVGLSLIVGLFVFNASFKSGWQFPKQFPEGFVWSFNQIEGDVAAVVANTPGVGKFTVANAPNVRVEERHMLMEGLLGAARRLLGAPPVDNGPAEQTLHSLTWFLGIEPDSFFDMVHLEFVQGDEKTARRLLEQGGYVLIADDFARTRNKGNEEIVDADGNVVVSNEVRIWLNNMWRTFKVAGVVDSPALDIAASYFQLQSEAYMAAVGSVIGTNDDLKRLWDVEGVKLVLLYFDLPPAEVPAGWPPASDSPEAIGVNHMYYNESLPVERRWQNYREARVLQKIAGELNLTNAIYSTARELKDEIDAELTRMTYLLSAVPAVALIVAALGVANLMTANVASRTKQLATLRAVGATKSLVLRMVIGEALILGLLGSGLGLVLGLHLAWNVTVMTRRMWGYALPFEVPWLLVGAAIALTVGLCVLAGIGPARHASRTNVIEALHVS